MGIFKKHGNWYIDYYDQNRKRRREKIGPNKRQAKLVLQKRKVQVAENRFLDVQKVEKIKFKDFAKTYLETYAKPNKRSWKRDEISLQHAKKFFKGKYLHTITSFEIEEYKRERLQKVKPKTVNNELTCLKTMFTKAKEWGKIHKNPAKNVKLLKPNNRRLRYLRKEEINALYKVAADHLKPILIVALNTGMRKGEILNLKWEEVDLQRKIIYLIRTKNNERREIPINEVVFDTLIKLKKHPDSPYVFHNKDGKPFKSIKTSFWHALEKAGIKDFRFHDLRHTFTSHLVMAGVDLNTVKELLGHKDIKMTQRYAHFSPDHKKRAVETLCNKMDTIWTPREKEEKFTVNSVLSNLDS